MNKKITYKDSGVDTKAGEKLIQEIKSLVKTTKRKEILSDIGGFGAMAEIPKKYKQPILTSATDGVGTKLKLAIEFNKHQGVGIDLVAMCVNDLIVQGAEPLYFLDYFATSSLDIEATKKIIQSIAKGCLLANCSLIGGETAEMPGMYQAKDYDLAGFATGIVEKEEIISKSNVTDGLMAIALKSSGFHANGFSLIRKLISEYKIDLKTAKLGEKNLLDLLLEPTKIYVKDFLSLQEKIQIYSACHITGGGFYENIPRMLPQEITLKINKNSWEIPKIFRYFQELAQIDEQELLATFNCGIGFIILVKKQDQKEALDFLNKKQNQAFVIGETMKNLENNQLMFY